MPCSFIHSIMLLTTAAAISILVLIPSCTSLKAYSSSSSSSSSSLDIASPHFSLMGSDSFSLTNISLYSPPLSSQAACSLPAAENNTCRIVLLVQSAYRGCRIRDWIEQCHYMTPRGSCVGLIFMFDMSPSTMPVLAHTMWSSSSSSSSSSSVPLLPVVGVKGNINALHSMSFVSMSSGDTNDAKAIYTSIIWIIISIFGIFHSAANLLLACFKLGLYTLERRVRGRLPVTPASSMLLVEIASASLRVLMFINGAVFEGRMLEYRSASSALAYLNAFSIGSSAFIAFIVFSVYSRTSISMSGSSFSGRTAVVLLCLAWLICLLDIFHLFSCIWTRALVFSLVQAPIGICFSLFADRISGMLRELEDVVDDKERRRRRRFSMLVRCTGAMLLLRLLCSAGFTLVGMFGESTAALMASAIAILITQNLVATAHILMIKTQFKYINGCLGIRQETDSSGSRKAARAISSARTPSSRANNTASTAPPAIRVDDDPAEP